MRRDDEAGKLLAESLVSAKTIHAVARPLPAR